MFVLGALSAPTSGGASSLALRLLTGDGSSGLIGDESVTMSAPSGVRSGALVACGSAGRCCRNGEGSIFVVVDAMRPTPDGVGVNGGGLTGDSDAVFALRFFGSGVEGSSGIAKSGSSLFVKASSCRSVREALLLRFFGAAAGFSTLVYLASTLVVLPSTVVLLATRAERLRDMLSMLSRLRRVLTVREV